MGVYELLFICFILYVGSFIQGSASFGFGLVAVGLLSVFLSVKDSTLIILALSTVSSLGIIIKYRRSVVLRELRAIIASAIMGRIAAFFFLDVFGETLWIKKMLGMVLIAIVVVFIVNRKRNDETGLFRLRIVVIATGFLGGFVGGAFAVGGPFFVLYFLHRFQDKGEYTANMHMVAVITNVFTLSVHGVNGDISSVVWFYIVIGFGAVWLGVVSGLKCYNALPRHWVQRIAYAIVSLSGISIVLFS
ncbi:sulfite exporter TauE/SafE family protein [Paenibacillus chungangensis]|uniref:Probable membrane transporter protein n=1 Tax=Paenibacillus chungangensis TaxID=696535 RepID=A0ABW3HKY8_9BACL